MATRTEALAHAERLLIQLKRRSTDISDRDDYYAGEQPLKFATDEWATEHAARYKGFADNWCGVVADSTVERIHVQGFRLDSSAQLSAGEAELWRSVWLDNDMDAQAAQGVLETVVASRSYILVWGDEDTNEPVVTWEHPNHVIVEYDAENPRKRAAAIKWWLDDDLEYLNLYLRDEVWKWQRPRTSRSGLVLPTSFGGEWSDRLGQASQPLLNPIGDVPVVEMMNRPRLALEPLSDISGSMAMQDAINLLWAYLFNAADYASMPARVIMGQSPPKVPILNEAGQKVGEREVDPKELTNGRLMWLTGQHANIGTFPAAVLTGFSDIVEVAVGHLAAQTRTPQHYLIGKMANLSGDALKAAETGQALKSAEFAISNTYPIREVFRLGALVKGDDALARAAARGTVKWKDTESRSESQLADALQKLKDIGFPFEYLAERYGLDDTELDRVMRMRQAEANDPIMASIAAKLTQASGAAAPAVGV